MSSSSALMQSSSFVARIAQLPTRKKSTSRRSSQIIRAAKREEVRARADVVLFGFVLLIFGKKCCFVAICAEQM